MPVAMKGHAQSAVGKDVVLYCGAQFETAASGEKRKGNLTPLGREGWRLDTEALTYASLPDAPLGVKWAGSAAVGDAFYLLTGMAADSPATPRMFCLSMLSTPYEWLEMPSMRVGRFIPGIAVVGTKIYVIGGETAAGPAETSDAAHVTVDTMEIFDTEDLKRGWVGAPSFPGLSREAMGIAAVGKTLYMFGGYHVSPAAGAGASESDAGGSRLCANAYAYDAEDETWRRLPDPPFPCYGWQAGVWADRYIILAAGVRTSPVKHPGEVSQSERLAPNHRVLVYDVITAAYHELPTRLPAPPVAPAPADMAEDYSDPDRRVLAQKYLASVKEVSKTMDLGTGGFRISPGLSVIGDVMYITGGECLTPHAGTSDDVLLGTIVSDGANG